MQIKKQVQGVAVAVALLSVGMTAISTEARPWQDRDGNHRGDRYERNERQRYEGRYNNRRNDDPYNNRWRDNDRSRDQSWNGNRGVVWNSGRSRSRTIYYTPGSYHSSLPSGCRRVTVRQRTYYTPDNNVYFTYRPDQNIYVVVNNPFRFF